MLDIKLIRQDPKGVEKRLKTKDPTIDLSPLLLLDEEIRTTKAQVEELKATRNHLSKEIGEKKRQKEDTSELMTQVAGFGDKIGALDEQLNVLEKDLQHKLACLPNLPREEIKISADPKENVCIKTFGEKREFAFPFKNHVELNEKLAYSISNGEQKFRAADGLSIETWAPV